MGKGRKDREERRYCGTGKGKWISVGEEKEAGKKRDRNLKFNKKVTT